MMMLAAVVTVTAGLALMLAGLWLAWPPAAMLFGGVLLVAAGLNMRTD